MVAGALTVTPTTTTRTADEATMITKMSSSPQFDIVTDYSDHNFRDLKFTVSPNANKRIMKEWKILQDNLPSSIFVRVYENRVNLLRAAIQGAAGTPYHNGLFFFDISFPEKYPSFPPKVRYHSFGLRINPNLYDNGLICLSLLNTWDGKTCEMWNPRDSTVLQVLLSLQALVLNEKPYFNEPVAAVTSKAQLVEAKRYNEDVYTLNLKTMWWVLSRPPKNFEGKVKEHFKEKGYEIMRTCKEFAKKKRIKRRREAEMGPYKVMSDLVEVLISVEALPDGFEMKFGRKMVVNKKSAFVQGFVKRVFGKFKKVFGLKKNI